MKKGSFAGLLYREFYLGRQSYVTGLLSFAGFVLMGWLALLSLKYGNFGLLVGDGSDGSSGVLNNKEYSDALRLFITLSMKYMPSMGAGMIGMDFAVNTAAKDTLHSWNRFEHCTPVTAIRYAVVKTASTVISAAVSLILALLYLFPMTLVLGENFTYADFSIIVMFLTVMTIWGILLQIFSTLYRSKNKGMLVSTMIIMFSVVIISGTGAMKDREKNGIELSGPIDIDILVSGFTEKAQALCPIMLTVLIGSCVLLFVSMYLLYKRREK